MKSFLVTIYINLRIIILIIFEIPYKIYACFKISFLQIRVLQYTFLNLHFKSIIQINFCLLMALFTA